MNEEQKQCAKHTLVVFLAALAGSIIGTLIACHCCIKHAKHMYFYSKMAPMIKYFEDFRNFDMPQRHFKRPEYKHMPQYDREFFEEKYIIIPKDMFDSDLKDEKKLKTSQKK